MRRRMLFSAAASLVCALAPCCGDGPTRPEGPPQPSGVSLCFTGDTTWFWGGGCRTTVTWEPCPDADFAGYHLFRSRSPGIASEGDSVLCVFLTGERDSCLFVDSELDWGERYHYALRTSDGEQLVSWGEEDSISMPDPRPEASRLGLDSTWGRHNALSWTPCRSGDFRLYRVFRSRVPDIRSDPGDADTTWVIVDPSETHIVDSTFEWGMVYYALRTEDSSSFQSWGNELAYRFDETGYRLPTPSLLRLDSLSEGEVSLSWTVCPDDDFRSYALFRSELPDIRLDPEQAEMHWSVPERLDTAFVDSMPGIGLHYYALRTMSAGGFFSWSNEVDVRVTQPPDPEHHIEPGYPWRVIQELDVGGCPSRLSMRGGTLSAVLVDGTLSRVLYFDYSAGTLNASSVPVSPVDVCAASGGGSAVIASDLSRELTSLTLPGLLPLGSLSVEAAPSCLASGPGGGRVYCGCLRSGTVYSLEPEGLGVTGRTRLEGGPSGLACSPGGDLLFVSCRLVDSVRVLSCPDLSQVGCFPVGDGPGPLTVSVDGSRLYVLCQAEETVHVVSTGTWETEHVISGAGTPADVCEHPGGELLYVSDSAGGRVLIYRTDTWQLERVVDTGPDARGLDAALDGSIVMVAGGSSGSIVVLGE